MNTSSSLLRTIQTPYSDTRYYRFLDGNLYFESLQKTTMPTRLVDAFSNFWSLAYVLDLPTDLLSLNHHGESVPIFGDMGLFIPPFSILDWRLKSGQIEWKSIMMFSEPPVSAPKSATLFPLKYVLPFTKTGINNEVFELMMTCGQRVDKEDTVVPLGLRAKKAIDLSFNDSKSLGDLAREIKCSPSALSRAFKKTYEISPVCYRNQLRVFDASIKLLKGESVIQAAHEVGFQDLSRFNKQFKEKMRAIPRQFKTVVPN